MKSQSRAVWGYVLYALTLLLEIPAIVVRFLVLWLVATLVISLTSKGASGGSAITTAAEISMFIAVLPVLVSLATLLFLPSGGGWLTRREMQARKPSDREQQQVDQAFDLLLPEGSKVKRPKKFYIVPNLQENAAVIGTTLYINQGLLRSPFLVPLLAHDLGHLNTSDGRLIAASRRFVFPGLFSLGQLIVRTEAAGCFSLIYGLVFLVMSGGLGLFLLGWFWRRYRGAREFNADQYAAVLGQAGPLVDYLEQYVYLDILIPYIGDYHPPAEYRIDRLLQYQESLE